MSSRSPSGGSAARPCPGLFGCMDAKAGLHLVLICAIALPEIEIVPTCVSGECIMPEDLRTRWRQFMHMCRRGCL